MGRLSWDLRRPCATSYQNSATLTGIYLEDNIEAVPGTNLIPGIRFDYHNQFGSNWSPSLNLSQALGDMFTLKAGIARVFKAPNLYQSSEDYLLSTRGNGCPNTIAEGSCYLLGNPDLDPEISINKEIGIEFNLNGYAAGVTGSATITKTKSSPEPRCWAIPPAAIISCNGRTAAKQ